jgi:hypothetical protein
MNQTAAVAAITMSGMGPIICHLRLCRSCKFMIASQAAGFDPRTAQKRPHQDITVVLAASKRRPRGDDSIVELQQR